MKTAIDTQLPQFQNDIADVVRLFYGEGAAVTPQEPHDALLVHTHRLDGSQWCEAFTLTAGDERLSMDMRADAVTDGGLEDKRQLKRLVKRCCYQLLKRYTGRTPAWGSLTGIRPTRLYYQQLERGKSRGEARTALHELFDLSEEKLDLLDEIITAQSGWVHRPQSACDLYVGIPFCTTRCAYCSFSSGEIGNGRLVEPYLAALMHEIDLCSELAQETGLQIRVGYVGGGTPSSLTTAQLDRLLTHIERRFGPLDEFTVEAGRPDTLDEEKLSMLRAHPVTRISINPQTMNDKTLRVIGRAHTAQQVEEAYAMARTAKIHHINMDVIAGLPGENIDDFARTMDAALRLTPESLTVHTLAIKRSSRLHLENAPLPDGETASRMVQLGLDTAHQLGMKPYYLYRQKYMAGNLENVGYARPGKACLYNIGNMEETASVLALGAGAISKWLFARDLRIERAANVKNIEEYTRRVEEMVQRKRDLILPEEKL